MKGLRSIFLVCSLLVCSSIGAQDVLYRIECVDLSIIQVLKQLEREYALKFSYDPREMRRYNITLNFKSNNPDLIVEELIRELPFRAQMVKGVYLLIPDKSKDAYRLLTGKVLDASSGEPLAFAHIQSRENAGTISNLNGTFSLQNMDDSLNITVTHVGYKSLNLTVKPHLKTLEINLQPDTGILPEFIITRDQNLPQYSSISRHQINPNQVRSLPNLGETDLFKSLQLLPGVKATDESSSGLSIRGSSPDQNLVLFDNLTLYHIDHFFGIFSTLNPFIVDRIDLYKGGFDAKYGGRLSSVIDARSRVGNRNEFKAGVNINTVSINAYMETPLAKKSSLILAYRRSFQEISRSNLYNQFIRKNRVNLIDSTDPYLDGESITMEPDFYFDDFSSKLRIRPTENSFLDLNLYFSNDVYNGIFEEGDDFLTFSIFDDAGWGNVGAGVNWTWFKGHDISSSLIASLSEYHSTSTFSFVESYRNPDQFTGSADSAVIFDIDTTIYFEDYHKENYVTDLSLKWERNQVLDDETSFSLGTELNVLNSEYSMTYFQDFNETFSETGFIASGYTQYDFVPGNWKFNIGLRGSYYNVTDSYQFEPRLRASYNVNNALSVKSGWSVHHQYINQLSISPFGNSDQNYWVLADDEIYPLMRSRHLIAGFDLEQDPWTLDVEVYHKKSQGIIISEFVLFSAFNGLDFSEFEDLVIDGNNESSGIDLLLKRTTDTHTSWLSYSIARSRNSIPVVNGGSSYPANHDQLHEINFAHVYKLDNWEFSTVFIYGSGIPYTPPGQNELFDPVLYDLTAINSLRLPDYHRLDLSAKRKMDIGKFSLEAGLTIFNLYNRKNIKSRRFGVLFEFDDDFEPVDSHFVPIDVRLLGLTPNFFLNLRF